MSSPIEFRAVPGQPCPCCGAETKGCSATADGLHLCRGEPRPGWREVGRAPDTAGFRHFRRDHQTPSRKPRGPKATTPPPPTDWGEWAGRYAGGFTAGARAELADRLGLPAGVFDALPLLGVTGRSTVGYTHTFPECDATGRCTGISERIPQADGKATKRMMKGGKRGLTLPAGWADRPGPVFVVEGPTDALAMTAAGLACVGRPSNTGGTALLTALFQELDPGRDIIVLGENDQSVTGWPGLDGAIAVAQGLAERLGRPIRRAMPPEPAKDVRAWLTAPARGDTPWPDRGRELADRLAAGAVPTDPPGNDPSGGKEDGEKKPPAAADVLTAIGLTADLWHDPTLAAFATLGRHTHPVRSKMFRHFLTRTYRDQTGGKVPNAEAMAAALNAIEAVAVCDGPERPVFVRVAGHGGKAYLHLADADSTVVEIDAGGWRTCENPPVRFRKPAGMLALPLPEPGGMLADLHHFLNVPDDGAFALVVAWLAAAFRFDGPFPVVVLLGEQGSAKSTTARVLKKLLDPSSAPLRSEPKEARDLMIQARYGWVLGFDNFSGLPGWLSDAFCRLATGGGFSTRELYSNDDEVIFDAKRPLVVNGIEDFITRADLLERSLLIRHPPIPEDRRRPEAEFWAAFDAAHPKLLGAVLDRVSAGLRELPRVRPDRLPRMADFALYAVACERGAGEEPRFLAAYAENQAGAHEQALDASPLPGPLVQFMAGRGGWRGTPRELLDALGGIAPSPVPRDWPKKPNVLTNRLRRLAPDLRRVHRLDVDCDGRSPDRSRTREITITRVPDSGRDASSAPSTSSEDGKTARESGSPCGRSPDGQAPPRSSTATPGKPGVTDGADDVDDVPRPLSGPATKNSGRKSRRQPAPPAGGLFPRYADQMLPD